MVSSRSRHRDASVVPQYSPFIGSGLTGIFSCAWGFDFGVGSSCSEESGDDDGNGWGSLDADDKLAATAPPSFPICWGRIVDESFFEVVRFVAGAHDE